MPSPYSISRGARLVSHNTTTPRRPAATSARSTRRGEACLARARSLNEIIGLAGKRPIPHPNPLPRRGTAGIPRTCQREGNLYVSKYERPDSTQAQINSIARFRLHRTECVFRNHMRPQSHVPVRPDNRRRDASERFRKDRIRVVGTNSGAFSAYGPGRMGCHAQSRAWNRFYRRIEPGRECIAAGAWRGIAGDACVARNGCEYAQINENQRFAPKRFHRGSRGIV